ncbi:ribbon-helix-helix domain-containing protein [Cyanobacterium sp. DS4]|uniref:ribbon-helix-helix domain-containing protein n=1 Tax=Cyanobacterium sp. DS4 TaxID=2878255 RepID=UPI002E81A1A1|nr:ribbon-helix-helix domain-containing protein [Cyanobacterium sp. Dongsha4]WVL00250.1 ribbon-helix-helix domain-containing protein [Cyanobacterium sp. Dongsha4]
MARWSLVISENTDRTVRSYLGAIGAKKGGLSNLVEEAVKRYIFEKTVNSVKERNRDYSEEEIMSVIDEAIKETRVQNRS